VTPDPIAALQSYGTRKEKVRYTDAHRHHRDVVRAWIVVALFVVFLVVFGVKVYFASAAGFKETCALDQLFDPVLSGIAGAFTTVLGFYFSERAGRG
jgi:hypothetical protein